MTKKTLMSLILLLTACTSLATEVYISRDANGNVIFSDKPGKNSEKHAVKELPSIPAYVAPPTAHQPAKVNEPSFNYTSLTIITPTNGQDIPTGFAGNVEVSGVLSPALREADTLYLLDNGEVLRQGRQTAFQLTNLSRGEHALQLVVRDKAGNTITSSNVVTIYVQRASVLNRSGR
ncbi:DUF4124 domain-containing protein [Thalassolituus hydrocarboniclasticus]|uniref:DUF4124 domain-containing protein n=1 Tax=Thalassolituus hydrocarboniclasticus TaxID=2742796 RepID=A0ABY6A7L1_9GAMM|nr:DUF4124 domain-containing protein [Thalassolituus hydrocarboniclasticus]UXD86570.1 DUF4124 domain-containing protein [Thalassolituus hydrocarboniclasticus]